MIDRLLRTSLEPIARSYRQSRLWRGLAWCWTIAALVGLAALRAHHSLDWPAGWLFAALAIGTLVAVIITIRRIRKTPPDYQSIAREIESQNPELHALLLTAVEQHPQSDSGELNYLQQRVIGEALEHHQRSPWGQRMARQLSIVRGAHWATLLMFLFVLARLHPSLSGVSGSWADAEHSNGVAVTPGDTNVERGNGLVILAKFEGKLPSDAELVINPVNEAERRVPLAKNLADPVFGGSIPAVKGDLKYHIEFSHGRTRDFKVTVFDYPRLERADAKLTYPAYTGLPEKTIPDTRRVSAVEGTSLDYSFFLNKPVTSAKLVGRDKSVVPLATDSSKSSVYHAQFNLDQSKRYELLLVDDAGRSNRIPPEFILDALKKQPPELKLASPRGDQRVSPLEEISFEGETSDDFGLRSYGIAYTVGDGETKTVELGQNSKPREKRALNYLLPVESLGVQPDQVVSYYLWADDIGPDGKPRRTTGDMFFAEIRPFDEIFREGQPQDPNSDNNNNNNNQNGQGNQTERLADLQKQIISATWNLKRRETGPKPSEKYKDDAQLIQDSQEQALEQARAMEGTADDRLKSFVDAAEKAMTKAAGHLAEAAEKNSPALLPSALTDEQAAYQALLKLSAREYQVTRGQRQQRGGGRAGSQRAQRQLDQLDLKQTANRYETQRQAASAQTPQQREQLQVANRLKELAQRQQDLNQRIRELQTALQEAKTDQQREDLQQRLKRLREQQQDMLADVDELRQRMDQPENQSSMSQERQQLDQTRSEVQQTAQALDQQSVSQALSSGTRAQRQLQQLNDDFRKKNSGQFSEEMRQMRNDAQQLAQNQEDMDKKINELADPTQKKLNETDQERKERSDLAEKLEQQKNGLTNLFTRMREISEQSETAEPLLSSQLYNMLRQTSQDDLDKALDSSAELVGRGFAPQAAPFEQRAKQNIDELNRGVQRAAESVLGDGTEALRLAQRELNDLSQQLDRELAQSGSETNSDSTNNAPGADSDVVKRLLQRREQELAQNSGDGGTNSTARRGGGQNQSQQQPPDPAGREWNQNGRPQNGQQDRNGDSPTLGDAQGRSQQVASANSQPGGNNGNNGPANPDGTRTDQGSARRDGARTGAFQNLLAPGGNAGGDGGAWWNGGPLIGDDYVVWSDRLRNAEEMIDVPDLRTDVARIRDRARAVRLDYKHLGKKPDWAVIKAQIAAPLAEVRSRVDEELIRRESKDALVPLDRDPVPSKFSDLVRRYYEQLGKDN